MIIFDAPPITKTKNCHKVNNAVCNWDFNGSKYILWFEGRKRRVATRPSSNWAHVWGTKSCLNWVFFRSLKRPWKVLVYKKSFKCISICHRWGFLFFILYGKFLIVLLGSLWLVVFSELFSLIKWFLIGSNLNLIGNVFFRVFTLPKFWISIKKFQISWLGSCM